MIEKLIPEAAQLGVTLVACKGSVYRVIDVVGRRPTRIMREIRLLLGRFNASLPVDRANIENHGIRLSGARVRRAVQKTLFARA